MPVILDIALTPDTKTLLYRQGIGAPDRVKPRVVAQTKELLNSVYEEHLLKPAIAYEIYAITSMERDQLYLEDGTVLHSWLVSASLSEAKALGIAIYTIGAGLEEKASDYFQRNEPLKALLLDGIGNAFLDSLSQEVCQVMSREASLREYKASSPVNPGVPGWPISDQQALFRLVPAGEAGIRLTEQAMMVPRKSLSAVFGFGTEVPEWTQAESCRRCNLKDTCPYRLRT